MPFNDLDIADFAPKVRYNTGVFIRYNAPWRSKTAFNVLKK